MDLNAVSGSFVVNPPIHCDDLIEAALNHIDRLLTESNDPLSFIIFLVDGNTTFVQKLDSSQFKRHQVVIPAYEHYYRHGFQYSVPKYEFKVAQDALKTYLFNNCCWIFRTDVNIRSPTSTLVVWLQNNAGCQRWSPSEDRVEALLEAFRPGRERDRDRDRQELLSPTPNPLLGPPPLPV